MMAIQYTVSRNVQELLADAKWKAWKKRTEGKHHSSAAECIEPDPYGYCESPSLRLTTYVRIGKEKREWTDEKGKVKTETDNSRSVEIPSIVQCCNKKPQESDLIALFRRIPGSVSFVAELKSRLIVNQAGGVIENGALCLHPHFGYPYIPGSAVKGCARHAAWQAWNEAEEDDAKMRVAKEVAEIFGFPTEETGLDEYLKTKCGYEKAQSGKVAFLAAVPETKAQLVTDVVTCHHPKYYAGQKSDAIDDESPIPNVFPAVREGSRFGFSLAPCGVKSETLKHAKHWLVIALTGNGVGAKTAAGYGWFAYDEVAENAKEAKRKEEENKKLAAEAKVKAEAEAMAKKEAERLARLALPVLEQWAGVGGASAVCGKGGKTFEAKWNQATEGQRKEIVLAMQSADGLGHEVWQMLRADKRRKNPNAVSSIFKFANEHKLGRMPQ